MTEVYVGLGSNLDSPSEKICQARKVITDSASITELGFSSLYSSPPMGPQDQPDYVNAVMSFETGLKAIDLLRVLQHIECEFGRVRKEQRWGARTLDLDILIYGNEQINLPDLIVPHIGVCERAFVLHPLNDIAPIDFIIPGKGLLKEWLVKCPLDGLEKLV